MNDKSQTMTDVLAAASSALDNPALSRAIARERERQAGTQILTRAQQRLEQDELRHAELVKEKSQFRDDIERTRQNISKLQEVLAVQEHNLADIEVEDASCLESIHALRNRGVDL
jgi:chromosome segregation ATPase